LPGGFAETEDGTEIVNLFQGCSLAFRRDHLEGKVSTVEGKDSLAETRLRAQRLWLITTGFALIENGVELGSACKNGLSSLHAARLRMWSAAKREPDVEKNGMKRT
jgi:hypothetical protein